MSGEQNRREFLATEDFAELLKFHDREIALERIAERREQQRQFAAEPEADALIERLVVADLRGRERRTLLGARGERAVEVHGVHRFRTKNQQRAALLDVGAQIVQRALAQRGDIVEHDELVFAEGLRGERLGRGERGVNARAVGQAHFAAGIEGEPQNRRAVDDLFLAHARGVRRGRGVARQLVQLGTRRARRAQWLDAVDDQHAPRVEHVQRHGHRVVGRIRVALEFRLRDGLHGAIGARGEIDHGARIGGDVHGALERFLATGNGEPQFRGAIRRAAVQHGREHVRVLADLRVAAANFRADDAEIFRSRAGEIDEENFQRAAEIALRGGDARERRLIAALKRGRAKIREHDDLRFHLAPPAQLIARIRHRRDEAAPAAVDGFQFFHRVGDRGDLRGRGQIRGCFRAIRDEAAAAAGAEVRDDGAGVTPRVFEQRRLAAAAGEREFHPHARGSVHDENHVARRGRARFPTGEPPRHHEHEQEQHEQAQQQLPRIDELRREDVGALLFVEEADRRQVLHRETVPRDEVQNHRHRQCRQPREHRWKQEVHRARSRR